MTMPDPSSVPVEAETVEALFDSLRECIHAVIVQTRGFNERKQELWCSVCRPKSSDALHDPECGVYRLHSWLDDGFPKLLSALASERQRAEIAEGDAAAATALVQSIAGLIKLPDDGDIYTAIDDILAERDAERQRAEQAERERGRLRNALAGIVGASDPAELEQMEAAVRMMSAPADDKARSIDAIHALLATVTK